MLHNLTIPDLRLALDDMLERRLETLRATGVGRCYEPSLVRLREQLAAHPESIDDQRPLVALIGETRRLHRAWGSALFHAMEAYARVPTLSEGQRKELEELRRLFMPKLGELRESYATAAARAFSRGRLLGRYSASLASFPVLGDCTLADWAAAYVATGRRLGELVACRADLVAQVAAGSTERTEGGRLRSIVIGLLGRLRAALVDELATQPSLHRQLDAELFAYVDELARMRSGVAQRAREAGSVAAPLDDAA